MISLPGRRAMGASLAILALAISPSAFAQEVTTSEVPANDDSLIIGAGVAYSPSYEGSDNYIVVPAVTVSGKISGHNFFTRGTSLYFDLIPEKPGNNVDFSFGPVANVRLTRTRQIKDRQVRALGKLDTAVEVGAYVGVAKTGVITSAYDTLGARVSYLRDVTNTHDSFVIQPAIEYGTPLSKSFYVGIAVSADYAGDGFADTYYSVSPAGTLASGLTTYNADGGWKNVTTNLLANYAVSGDLRHGLSLFATGAYSKMLDDFKRSPIVSEAGDDNQWFAAVGVAYSF